MGTILIIAAVIVILLVVLVLTMYVKAPPSYAYILSGVKKEPRTLIGTGGVRIPFFERLDKVYLGQVTVDVKTSTPVPTHDYIDVSVDAVCKVRVMQSPEGTRLAAKNFLNMTSSQMSSEITDTLEGNMREVVGAIDLKVLVTDRDSFSDEIQKKAEEGMQKLGLEIISCNIQNITETTGLIESLGADNSCAIKKNAAIQRANSEKDIAIAQAKAKKEANDVQVKTETEIAISKNELDIKRSELKSISDKKQADADMAYEIQKQEQQKELNTKTVEAQIETTRQNQILSEENIKIRQNTLKSEVNAKADALQYEKQISAEAAKYEEERKAQAALQVKKLNAEAETYAAIKEAEAVKAKAEAERFKKEQEAEAEKAKGIAEAEATKAKGLAEAESIKAKGLAEAEAVRAKGLAEAEATDKKAIAMKKFGHAAVIEMLANVLPQTAEAVAKPLESIDSVNFYGGNPESVGKMSDNVPTLIKKTVDTIESVTGINLAKVAKEKLEGDEDNDEFNEVK